MPFPSNVDPARAFAILMRIPLPEEPDAPWREIAAEHLLARIEVPRTQLSRMCEEFEQSSESLDLPEGPAGWLELPAQVERLWSHLLPFLEKFMRVMSAESFGEAFEEHPLPDDVLTVLLLALSYRSSMPSERPGAAPRRFAAQLFAKNEKSFDRAYLLHQHRLNALGTAAEAAGTTGHIGVLTRALLAPSQVMYRLALAHTRLRKRTRRRAIEAALDAWSGAFEGQILDVCSFIWTFAQPLDAPPEALALPRTTHGSCRGELDSSLIFSVASEWCDREAIEFPFYRGLPDLHRSRMRDSYAIEGKRVTLFGGDGAVVDRLSAKQLIARASHDVTFAWHFSENVVWARVEHLERTGALDRAWDCAAKLIPELATAIKPARKRRRHKSALAQSSAPKSFPQRDKQTTVALPNDPPRLLLALFSESELRRWLGETYGREFLDDLPGAGAPPAEFAFHAIRVLEQRYGRYLPGLLRALLQARPNRTQDVLAVAAHHGVAVDDPPCVRGSPSRRP